MFLTRARRRAILLRHYDSRLPINIQLDGKLLKICSVDSQSGTVTHFVSTSSSKTKVDNNVALDYMYFRKSALKLYILQHTDPARGFTVTDPYNAISQTQHALKPLEADRISFSFYFSAPKKRIIFIFCGVVFFSRKRHPHFRFFSFFGTKMAVKKQKENQYFG